MNEKMSKKYLPSHKTKEKWSSMYEKMISKWVWIPKKKNEPP